MTPELAQEIKAESLRIAEEWPGVSPKMKEMLEFWRTECPNRWKELTAAGIAPHYARVMEAKMMKRMEELREQNNPEALSQATQEVLGDLMTPESELEEDAEENEEQESADQ